MDCKHAYFKDGVPYVLCECDGKPRTNRLQDVTPYMCAYQRFCPQVRTCTLLPTWVQCGKLRTAENPVVDIIPAVSEKKPRKKKS